MIPSQERPGAPRTRQKQPRTKTSETSDLLQGHGIQPGEALLTCAQFGESTGTSERFARRLIAERKIRFVRLGGRLVRIPASARDEFIAAGVVEPRGGAA